MGTDAGGDARTVGVHVGVEDREGVGDGGRGAGGDTDGTEDVDALTHRELAAEIGHVEHRCRVLHGGDGVVQRDEPVPLSDVVGVEVGQFQYGGGVAAVGGHQCRKPRQ
jgi:hypothetical protein